ncbi:MAG: hypothetical protein FJX65_05670 [Alphaproteobacteria bacterium]|nr:hypothetical protein [Alphaproteobacteria bacterium]
MNGWRRHGFAALLLGSVCLAGLGTFEALRPARGGDVIAVFPPTWSREQVLTAIRDSGAMMRDDVWAARVWHLAVADDAVRARVARTALSVIDARYLEAMLLAVGCTPPAPPRGRYSAA